MPERSRKLYALAERDAHRLNDWPHLTLDYKAQATERYRPHIFAALAYRNDAATVRPLLSTVTGRNSRECIVASLAVARNSITGKPNFDPGCDSVHSNLQTITNCRELHIDRQYPDLR